MTCPQLGGDLSGQVTSIIIEQTLFTTIIIEQTLFTTRHTPVYLLICVCQVGFTHLGYRYSMYLYSMYLIKVS